MRPESPVGARKDDGYVIFVSLDSYVGANNSKNYMVYDITITFMGGYKPTYNSGATLYGGCYACACLRACVRACVCVFCGIVFFVPEKDALQATNSYFRIS